MKTSSRICPTCAAEPGVPCLGMKPGLVHATRVRKRAENALGRPRRQPPYRSLLTGRCEYCDTLGGADGLTRDHVIPRSRGGLIVYVSACSPCNNRRGSMPYPAYALARGVPLARIIDVMWRAMTAYARHYREPPPAIDEQSYLALQYEPDAETAGWQWPANVGWTRNDPGRCRAPGS